MSTRGTLAPRDPLTPALRREFPVGAAVRYKPGMGVYGYEDAIEDDGCLAGVVVGHSDTRVRIELRLTKRGGATKRIAVNHSNLVRVREQEMAR